MTNSLKTALVIPTIRGTSLIDLLDRWLVNYKYHWDEIIVVEDAPNITFRASSHARFQSYNIKHVSWKEIDSDLGTSSWIISRKDSAIRSYGFLLAYRSGADVIFTLDDDCMPIEIGQNQKNFIEHHLYNLTSMPKWISSIPSERTRGLPYINTGKADNVVLSVGLWEGHTDFDAIQTLSGTQPITKTNLPQTRVMPIGQYFPMCGMNLCFKREIVPLMYFPLMGEGQPFRRFDDIWCGIICKKICDHLGFMIACGEPYIHHAKVSDPFENLIKEAPGIKANETFWQEIDKIQLTCRNVFDCMKEIGYELSILKDDYLQKLGEAIIVWVGLFANP